MEKSKRLKPVLRITESREESAARELGDSQRLWQAHKEQLAQLQTYRSEYVQSMQQQGRAGIDVARLLNLQRFLAQLDKAIAQQQQVVEQAAKVCAQKRLAWVRARRKTQVVDMVKTRFEAEERKTADKREQRETDERAQRRGKHEE